MANLKTNIISIPFDKKVNIEINGVFYQRLNTLLISYSDSVEKDKLLKALNLIKSKSTTQDIFAYNLETLLRLLKEIEITFDKAGLTNTKEIEFTIPDEEKTEKA